MSTLYTQSESNIRKTWLYLSSFFVLIIFLGWLFSYYLNSQIFLVIAVIYSTLASFISYWYSDKIVLAMSGARPIKKEDNPELYRIVENLCITAGLPLPKIYIINEAQPNAFATGRNPQHAVIAVTQGLLDRLEKTELEGVIAHELSHIGNRDTLLQTIVVILVGIIAMLTNFFFRVGFRRGFSSKNKNESGNIIFAVILVIGVILAILAPILANLIKLAISRKREFLADASGALLTRYPEGLAGALEKISQDPNMLPRATEATSHLYIINPFRSKQKESWISKLFITHPPVEERIKALLGMEIQDEKNK
jgi:heat shock protein HtpX